MPNKLEFIRDLLKFCFVPELIQDLDTTPIQREHFTAYHQVLESQLPLLYDFVQQHHQWILSNDEKDIQKVHACLIILLCEVTAPAIYTLANENLAKNANRLLEQHTAKLNEVVEQIVFTHYHSKLHKNCWKRQLGTVHGFMKFLEFRHNETTRSTTGKMSVKWLTFCLSVGLNVRECHEHTYKQIGTRIFKLMLHYASTEDIQELNIHSVIYDAVLKDVHFMDSVVATADIWSCLCKCLDYFHDIDSLSWNQADDMIEILIRNISLASDSLISICLLKFVTKLCSYFALSRQEIEETCNGDLNEPVVLDKCRWICSENNSYTSFRWAKCILNMFSIESYKLMQSPNISKQMLMEMHRCYLVCILPIPLQITEPHLLQFYDKFTAVLMEVILVHKQAEDIVKLVKCLIETFYLQLQRSTYCEESLKLTKFREAFEKLLQHDLFVQNK